MGTVRVGGKDTKSTMSDLSDRLQAYLREQLDKLATAEELERMVREIPALVESIRKIDRCGALRVVSGLMTIPEFQPNLIRLESLAHMVVAVADGETEPTREMIEQWVNDDLGTDIVAQAEDPVEDVFVSNVVTGTGNRRVFTGTWDTPDFWLQNLIDVLSFAPPTSQLNTIRAQVDSLLKLSEAVAERSGAKRFSISDGKPGSAISVPMVSDLSAFAERARFREAELQELGISREILGPFLFDLRSRGRLGRQKIGESALQRRPLIECEGDILLAIPEAIGAALRLYILEAMATIDAATLRAFEQALRGRQQALLFGEALRFSAAVVDMSKDLPPSSIDPKRLSQAAVRFDEGKFAHIVLLHDDCRHVLDEGLTAFNRPPEAFGKKLGGYIESCAKNFSGLPEYIGGMTLVVLGGVGRGFALMSPPMPSGWTLSVWSLADLYALAWMEHEWLLALWKLNGQVAQAHKSGTEIDTSDANIYSFWKENKCQLIPREYPVGSEHGSLSLDPGYIASFRQKFRILFDAHGVYRPDERRWIVVRKTFPVGFFKELQALPMYSSADDAARGRLRGVIETSCRAWWLDALTGDSQGDERELQFHLWEAALNWLARLAPEIESRTQDLPSGNIVVSLDVTKVQVHRSGRKLDSVSVRDCVNVSVDRQESAITVRVKEDFLEFLQRPANDAESELVRAIAEGAVTLAGSEDVEALSNAIRASIVTSTDARFLHVFTSPPSIRDELARFDRPVGRTVQEPDGAVSTTGLSWEILQTEKEGLQVSGRKKCNEFLNAAVDCLWNRIRPFLEGIDRNLLVEQCLRNHEGIQLDRDIWRRTSRALTAVYRDRDDVIAAARKHEADFSRATLSSRVLLEMGLCTCAASGGKKPGVAEFDELLAAVARLIAVAYDSDAMRAGLSEPRIEVFPNGQFLTVGKFYEETMLPYQSGHFAERFEEHVKKYPDLYEGAGRAGRPAEDVFDKDFISAFEDEYGISVQQLVDVATTLEEHAVASKRFVVKVSMKELKALLATRVGLRPTEVDAFLRNFCLSPRKRWDSTPNGFVEKDWYPWRFRRRLSLMARPVVLSGFDDDDPVFYTPGLVHDGFANLVVGSHSGGFDVEYFNGTRMKAWIGAVNNKRGHEFNEQVAEEFRRLNFQARASVQMAEFNVPPEMGDLGDIDVLAWNGSGRAYIVECKNLRFAMTVGEIVDQLNRFRGEANDELAKHIKRCRWLAQNPNRVARITGRHRSLELKSLMVTNTIVPMQFVRDLPIPPDDILPIGELSKSQTSG
jgi:hypothetical protein